MRVYLSYNHSDADFAAAVRESLIAGGIDVWNPETKLTPGSNWLKETGRALERADAIVFILSKRALRSPFLQKEIDYALTTKRFANRVYSVATDDARVPWILRDLGVIEANGSPKLTALRLRRELRKDSKPVVKGGLVAKRSRVALKG